jgi:hypothetical protein
MGVRIAGPCAPCPSHLATYAHAKNRDREIAETVGTRNISIDPSLSKVSCVLLIFIVKTATETRSRSLLPSDFSLGEENGIRPELCGLYGIRSFLS